MEKSKGEIFDQLSAKAKRFKMKIVILVSLFVLSNAFPQQEEVEVVLPAEQVQIEDLDESEAQQRQDRPQGRDAECSEYGIETRTFSHASYCDRFYKVTVLHNKTTTYFFKNLCSTI